MNSVLMKGVSNQLLFRIKHIGKLPICNCRKDRAPHIGDYCFILCWRCTSILFSFYMLKLFQVEEIIQSLWNDYLLYLLVSAIALIVPTGVNGVRQYFFGIESTNQKRIWTGLLAGIGLYLLMAFWKDIAI